MTREEAINLELEVRYSLTAQKHKEAVDVAFAALREQDERSKGCIHCSQESDIPLPTDMGFTWISGNQLQNSYGECVIEFCPMCGRKLEVEG